MSNTQSPGLLEQAKGFLTFSDPDEAREKLKQLAGMYFLVAQQKAATDIHRATIAAQREQRSSNLYQRYREMKGEKKFTEAEIKAMISADEVVMTLTSSIEQTEISSKLHWEMLSALRMAENIMVTVLGNMVREKQMAARS